MKKVVSSRFRSEQPELLHVLAVAPRPDGGRLGWPADPQFAGGLLDDQLRAHSDPCL
jgi:hypothetical protein